MKTIPTIYNTVIKDEDMIIHTPSDIHKLIYLIINSLNLGVELRSSAIAYIGNIEYEVMYITLNDSNTGTLSQISLMYRTCSEEEAPQDYSRQLQLDIVELICIEIPNIRFGAGTIVTNWSVNLNKKIEESEEDKSLRKFEERKIFGGEIEDFDIYEKDIFFKETLPRFLYTCITKYEYNKI